MNIYSIACRLCDYVEKIEITDEQQKRLKKDLIQDVLPHLSADTRELILSKTCGTCFDRLFNCDGDGE
jgi:hypothetical protein